MNWKTLIVDDSSGVRTKLRSFLEELGHSVVAEAENGLEAIDAYIQCRPDLVTMDIVMPELDGLSALEEIMKIDRAAQVIMVSSAATHAYRMQAANAGADIFVVKPVSMEKLKEALELLKARDLQIRKGAG